MKNLLTLALLTLFAIGCSSEADTTDSQAGTETPAAAATANTGKVFHYTCPNNCENSGSDAQGTCPFCNSALAHNQAWHSLPENQQTPPTTNPDQLSPIITTDGQVAPAVNPATPASPAASDAPAQNANGVWHYTCSNGCAGGGGAQGNCASCGSPLAHNTAYHQ